DEAPATSEAARVDGLDEIVAKALAQHSSVRDASAISQVAKVAKVANASTGAFDTMDEAISAAVLAQVQYRHCSMQDRASFI
ncbi:aldehyde dehydrogenase EutE, partial [Escherichia coli]